MKYWLSEHFILPLSDLMKGHEVYRYYKFFKRTFNWSQKEIRELQLYKLKKLLAHAYKHVPFYQQRFEENNFNPDKISSLDDLQLIPFLTRQDIQKDPNSLRSTKHQKLPLFRGSSSGSTGVPVFYYKDSKADSAGQAAGLIGWSMSGWKLGMKGLHIWGNPTTVNNEWERFGSKAKAFLFNHRKFPAYKLSDGKEFGILAKLLIHENYEFIDGYTNAIYLLSEYIKENNTPLNKKLKLVLTTAENLQNFQRKSINEFLGPVFDAYGCGEINGIANECKECGKYHIIDPHVYVEFGSIVDELGSRELIITDLDNYAFPLIRYKNGDVGINLNEKKIDCKINYSRMLKVSGRQSDIIKLPVGGTLSVPSFFGSMLLAKVKGIKHYQIIREKKDLLTVLLVKSSEFSENDSHVLNDALHDYLNGKINYRIQFVDKIDTSQTGKFKLLIDKTL
jgi:phenylacetate-CoA ligase